MPSEKAGTARQQALMTAASSATQTEMNRCPTRASVMEGGSFFDGFHAGASPVTLDRAVTALFHTTRIDLVSVPPIECIGCLAETSAGAEGLIFGALCANEPSFTLGKAETEGDWALKGLELSNYVLSPLRVGIKEWGVLGGDVGDRVEGASVIQGIDTSHKANQLVLALTEVETAYAVEVLGDVESSSPLMSINPLGVVVTVELNSNTEVR